MDKRVDVIAAMVSDGTIRDLKNLSCVIHQYLAQPEMVNQAALVAENIL